MVVVLVLLLGLVPTFAGAQQTAPVVINEIAWMGTPVEGMDARQEWRYEWLELYGLTERSVDLEGWKVELYRPFSAKATEGKGEELYFEVPLAGTIQAQGYFLIGASGKISSVDVNYANLGGKFLNEGMRVALKDNLGNVVDEVGAQEGWLAGDNDSKRTMERVGEDWQTSDEPGGTPKAENSAGFQEVSFEKTQLFPSKKDPQGSFSAESVFSFPVFVALLLALGSGVGVLGLRRFLSRQARHHFPNGAGQV